MQKHIFFFRRNYHTVKNKSRTAAVPGTSVASILEPHSVVFLTHSPPLQGLLLPALIFSSCWLGFLALSFCFLKKKKKVWLHIFSSVIVPVSSILMTLRALTQHPLLLLTVSVSVSPFSCH
jgi:hypothetical protein